MDSHSLLMFLYLTLRRKSNHVAENVSISAPGERVQNLLISCQQSGAILEIGLKEDTLPPVLPISNQYAHNPSRSLLENAYSLYSLQN